MRIIRVFPRRTKATPDDPLVYVGGPDLFAEADRINISVTFTWDIPEAERLEKEWRHVAPVSIGGPATGQRGEDFVSGMYLKKGYVITSRGCPNQCWFCSVPKREGNLRELPITDGWNVLDDNILACSAQHFNGVIDMLSRQPHRAQFTGGLEAARLQQWHIDKFRQIKPEQIFFAYDGPEDREPLFEAGNLLKKNGLTIRSRVPRAYCLVGFPKDTFDAAEKRLNECLDFGFMPMAMLYRDQTGERDPEWMRFQREWARPVIIMSNYMKEKRGIYANQ